MLKKRSLCVDDDAVNRMVMNHLLTPLGYEVDLAPNGKMALELFEQTQYDLILLDIMMPEMDGFELAGRIRSLAAAQPPIIFVSAYSPENLEENMSKNNISHFIPKPVIKERLYQIIAELKQ